MKPNELRIGNYVNFKNSETDLFTNDLPIDDASCLVFLEEGEFEAEPIPLTEEWLLKFGFEKTELGFSINLRDDNGIGENLLIDIKFNEAEIESYNYRFSSSGDYPTIFISTIKYVHQLQNLYFALTGEELKTIN